jgi:hypothetical protein
MTGSSGISSTLRLSDSITGALDYWIARFSAGDDGWEYSAFVLNELPPLQFFKQPKQFQTRVRDPAARLDCWNQIDPFQQFAPSFENENVFEIGVY